MRRVAPKPVQIGLILWAVIVAAEGVSACSCGPRLPSCEAYKRAPTVFIARVVDIDSRSEAPNDFADVRLRIEHSFKGLSETEIRMRQGTGSGDCSFVFERGESYLLYASYSSETKRFHTNICTRSRPIRYAAEDLDYLRGLPESDSSTRLSGSVIKYDYEDGVRASVPELISGVRMVIEGQSNKRFDTITNEAGFYKVVDLPPGRYKVWPELPSYLSPVKEESVDIPQSGCGAVDFLTRTDGRISGFLYDNRGHAVAESYVDLIPIELRERLGDRSIGRYEKTDKTGKFEFTELPPGRYLMGVNLRHNPESDTPFPRTYYPGVATLVQAATIVVGKGERLQGYNIRLFARLPVRTITGVFVWPDGKPVTKALLALKDASGQDLDFAEPDSQGRFTLKALKGTKGSVHGSTMVRVESGIDIIEAIPVPVTVNSNVGPIRLVAKRKSKGGVRFIP